MIQTHHNYKKFNWTFRNIWSVVFLQALMFIFFNKHFLFVEQFYQIKNFAWLWTLQNGFRLTTYPGIILKIAVKQVHL